MTDKVFVDGIFPRLPSPKAPDFIKLGISFNVEQFTAFLKANTDEKGYCRITIKESKKETLYAELDTYQKPDTHAPRGVVQEISPDDIPF